MSTFLTKRNRAMQLPVPGTYLVVSYNETEELEYTRGLVEQLDLATAAANGLTYKDRNGMLVSSGSVYDDKGKCVYEGESCPHC